MSEVNPNYNPQADFDNFGEEMRYIVETTPKEVLKEEWDKVLKEYGTDMKTPMQEHIEWLKDKLQECIYDGLSESYLNAYTLSIKHAESMLEKEKEAMREFAWEYERDCRINLERSIEKCWDKTFNAKEK